MAALYPSEMFRSTAGNGRFAARRERLAMTTCFPLLFVRRQSFWDREQLKIRESLARLVCDVMRPADGAASGDLQLSVV